jgi:hypothetical protein
MGVKLTNMKTITDTFRPKADVSELDSIVKDAWKKKSDELQSRLEEMKVAAWLRDRLEELNPSSDMEVLRRYGFTRKWEEVTVQVWGGDRWGEWFGITLPSPVEASSNYANFICGGPKAENRDSRTLPEQFEPLFLALVEARKGYKDEYSETNKFPKAFKQTHGRYPTWQEIADRYPVVGSELRLRLTTK